METLREPAIFCAEEVSSTLESMAFDNLHKKFERFSEVVSIMRGTAAQVLNKQLQEALLTIETIIQAQQNYFFTADTEYHSERTGLFKRFFQGSEEEENLRDLMQMNARLEEGLKAESIEDIPKELVTEIRERIDKYFSLVIRSCKDIIPKIIGLKLINEGQPKLRNALQALQFSEEENVVALISEVSFS